MNSRFKPMLAADAALLAAALLCAAPAHAADPTNLPAAHPDNACKKPVKPQMAANKYDNRQIDEYNAMADAYNALVPVYAACIKAYVEAANADTALIERKARAALDAAKAP